MIRPNYRDFRKGSQIVLETGVHLEHSAKGSTWEKHKYIKRIEGTYYYPKNYKGGRHLPDRKKKTSMGNDLFEKLKGSNGDDLDGKLRGSFDKILREKLGVDWTTLSKEEIDKMQRSLIDRLKAMEKEKKESFGEKVELTKDEVEKLTKEVIRESSGEKVELTKDEVENLAKEVIRGNFGNGQTRKDLLGENYAEVQKRVNELMNGSTGQKKVSEATQESVKKAEEAAKKADASNVHSGIDMEKVQSVYRNKKIK